jgi:hypothetical protein
MAQLSASLCFLKQHAGWLAPEKLESFAPCRTVLAMNAAKVA